MDSGILTSKERRDIKGVYPMNLNQLYYFRALADWEHYTRAAIFIILIFDKFTL